MAVPSHSVSRAGRSAPSSTPAAQVTVPHVEKAGAEFTVPSSTRATVTREDPVGTGTDTGDDSQLTEISAFDQLGPKPTRTLAGGRPWYPSSATNTRCLAPDGTTRGVTAFLPLSSSMRSSSPMTVAVWAGSLPVLTSERNSARAAAIEAGSCLPAYFEPRKALKSTGIPLNTSASVYCQTIGVMPP